MSDQTIERHRVIAFARNLTMTPQTDEFILREAVEADLAFTEPGKYFTDELIGPSDPQPILDRFGDTPSKTPERLRRIGVFQAYEDFNWLDNVDKARELVDPEHPIVQSMRAGVYRNRDNTILKGLVASSREGETGETVTVFPSGNVLSNATLTVGKLREMMTALDNGKVKGPRFFAGGATDKAALLGTTEVTSSDFNSVRALVNGEVDTFLGFKFKWFPDDEIPLVAAKRRCIAWAKPAAVYKSRPIVGGEEARIVERGDKRFNWQAYLSFDHAFMRRHDDGVVAIDIG